MNNRFWQRVPGTKPQQTALELQAATTFILRLKRAGKSSDYIDQALRLQFGGA